MSTKYKIDNPEGIYFISFAVVEWVDVFTRPVYKDVFVESLKYCQDNKGLIIYAWCLMTNLVHLIASAKNGNLSNILRDLKKYTSVKIVKEIEENDKESRKEWMLRIFKEQAIQNSNNTKYQFWRQNNQPKELFSYINSFMEQKLHYIHENPIKENIVEYAEEYLYSSAKNYLGKKGLIEVELLI